MRKLLSFLILIPCLCVAQIPVVHINFVSHNEPVDNLQNAIPFNYQRQQVQILADLMVEKNAAWNLETCDGFAIGARNHQGVTNNIFRTLAGPTYSGVIEIDPRNKNITNIADLAWLLDTLGAEPTNTVGGFTYYNEFSEPDWWEYEDTVVGVDHPYFNWKANLLWGAGSLRPCHFSCQRTLCKWPNGRRFPHGHRQWHSPQYLTSTGTFRTYLAKFDTDGNLLWAQMFDCQPCSAKRKLFVCL